MSIRASRRKSLRFLLLSSCFLVFAFAEPTAFAAVTDCVEDDPVNGRFICFAEPPRQWGIGPCENTPDLVQNQRAWCESGGGTFVGGNCPGFTPSFEEDIPGRSLAFLNALTKSECSIVSDTGWNATFDGTSFCNGGAGAVFQEGWQIRDSRRVIGSCPGATVGFNGGSLDIRWSKSRALECPFGSTPRTVVRNGHGVTACTLPVDCPYCQNKVGNPVSAAVGTKIETETDYRGAGGLVFTRHYQSWHFPDPVTLTPDGHSQLQLGATWRSNFDKRVIPVGNTPGINALTFPDGQIQYFDSLGKEIFNYTGARATLVILPGGGYVYQGPDSVETYRADGRLQSITQRSGETLTLTYSGSAFGGVFVDRNGNPTSEALPANLLLWVTDSYGNALSFAYSAPGKLVVMTDPSGGRALYTYDVFGLNDNLASVTFPDGHTRSYRYAEAANMPSSFGGGVQIHALTSIVDENGDLYGTFKYDLNGRILSSEHALGTERYQFIRPNVTTTNITDPLGTTRTFSFQVVDGITRLSANSLPGGSGFGVGIQNQTYDASGNLLSKTDFNNSKTCYAYDTVRNLETVRVEGLAAATSCNGVIASGVSLPGGSRKTTTEWHPRWRLPARTSEPNRRTTYVYNGDAAGSCAPVSAVIADGSANGQPIGVLCAKTVQSTGDADGSQGFAVSLEGQSRTWSYTYSAHGKVLTADGPRTDLADITTTSYYADDDPDLGKRGNVATVTNALGHTTQITAYNAHGQPLTIVDPNGLTTTLTYDARQRLTLRNVGGETTIYTYDGVGQLVRVTLPDGSFLAYGYNPAHRLTGIADNLGNSISYTLDAMGNRTKEDVLDTAGSLAQTRSRVYDALNRLSQEIGAQSQTTQYAYDDQGNVTGVTDPLNHATVNQYDALNRLKQVTDPNQGQTLYAYNGVDQLVSVTDPRNLTTSYNYDGLANLNAQSSPDTGTTANVYDEAGNLLLQTDAKGQTASYGYDALNRVTFITFTDGSRQIYGYDQGANGLGRLTFFSETNAASQTTSLIDYGYDQHGRMILENRWINGFTYATGYGYDAAGRLNAMTYPSGRTVAYAFDALGRVSQVSTTAPPASGGATQIVASNISYQPFGGVKSYMLGNGQTYSRGYDLDGRIVSYGVATLGYNLGYDPAGRIVSITDALNAVNFNTYGYDSLDRLTSAVTPAVSYGYGYDAVGNRTLKTVGTASDTYTYSTTSNRIASIAGSTNRSFSFDPNGSTTSDGPNQYSYDSRGRMGSSTSALGTTFYQVNALGQRVRKTNSTEDRVFVYDTRGRLIAETDPGGGLKREYLYLNDIPLAVIQ